MLNKEVVNIGDYYHEVESLDEINKAHIYMHYFINMIFQHPNPHNILSYNDFYKNGKYNVIDNGKDWKEMNKAQRFFIIYPYIYEHYWRFKKEIFK